MSSPSRRDLLKLGLLGASAGLIAGRGAVAATAPTVAAVAAEAAPSPLRILILGGTGFTGPHQVRHALERGHRVTLFNRGRRPQDWPAEVEELTGDRESNDYAALDGRSWDVCIDNPTSVPIWINQAAKVLKGQVGHYVFISTISVFAATDTPGMDESAAVATYGGDPLKVSHADLRANMALYGPMKAASEAEARAQYGEALSIIRPGLIVGPGDPTDRFTYWPLRLARGGDVLAPGDGSDPVQFIDARDLAEWTVRVAELRAGGIFNATGPDYELSMAAMLYGMRASTTAGTRLHWAPLEFLQQHQVAPWSDLPVWLPGSGDTAGFSRVSNRRAIEHGLSFRSLAHTTSATLDWYAGLPTERQQAPLAAGLSSEREAELLHKLKRRA